MSKKDRLFKLIDELQDECKKDGWDGWDADKITKKHAKLTKLYFIELLEPFLSPKAIEFIEVTPESEGTFSFDWFLTHDKQASLSIYDKKYHFVYRYNQERYNKEVININKIIPLINKLFI